MLRIFLVLVALAASFASAAPQLIVPSGLLSTTPTASPSTPSHHHAAKRTASAPPPLYATYFTVPAPTVPLQIREAHERPTHLAPKQRLAIAKQYNSWFPGDRRAVTPTMTTPPTTLVTRGLKPWRVRFTESRLADAAKLSDPQSRIPPTPKPLIVNDHVPLTITPSAFPDPNKGPHSSPYVVFGPSPALVPGGMPIVPRGTPTRALSAKEIRTPFAATEDVQDEYRDPIEECFLCPLPLGPGDVSG